MHSAAHNSAVIPIKKESPVVFGRGCIILGCLFESGRKFGDMGKIKSYQPVKLIAAVAIKDKALWEEIAAKLQGQYGPIDMALDWYDFTHTDYYQAEMGEGLFKRMISFETLIPAETLPDIKIATNDLEDDYAQNDKRIVNIDPGYITAPRLVLATTKDYSHRLFLGKGIFGDIHLQYLKGQFQPQYWTYPDYKEDSVLAFFTRVREVYMMQLGFLYQEK